MNNNHATTTTTTATPFAALVNDAIEIRDNLLQSADDLAYALEREQQTKRTAKEQREAYESDEAEVIAEAYAAAQGKNAETRKAEVDAMKVVAQRVGVLAKPLAMRNAADADADEARSAREQRDARYRALRSAAELTAAILGVVSTK